MNVPLAGATVLVGIDFSEPCEQALLHAVTLAERTEARIELVHVFEWTRLGAHGRRALQPGTVGTTAERVRASSGVPVLLVSRPEPAGKIESPSVPPRRGDSVVCSCSRCGMVARPPRPSRKCVSCGSQPGIWVSGPGPERGPLIGDAQSSSDEL